MEVKKGWTKINIGEEGICNRCTFQERIKKFKHLKEEKRKYTILYEENCLDRGEGEEQWQDEEMLVGQKNQEEKR